MQVVAEMRALSNSKEQLGADERPLKRKMIRLPLLFYIMNIPGPRLPGLQLSIDVSFSCHSYLSSQSKHVPR